MNDLDFENFCRLIYGRSGLSLNIDKAYLVQSRLEPVARANGMAGVPALLAALRMSPQESVVRQCVDAMATHESLFFRDQTPFDQLATLILQDLAAARAPGQAIRIWCAACSSGQEPYSLAILMQEQGAILAGRPVQILATDMSQAILEKARAGVYSDFEAQRGLSPERLKRWFTPHRSGWEVSDQLKAMVTFRPHNLLEGMSDMTAFDIVFCRNVLIYFDAPRKTRVLEQIAGVMAQDGALFLGSAETVIGLTDAFALMPGSRGVYRPAASVSLARSA